MITARAAFARFAGPAAPPAAPFPPGAAIAVGFGAALFNGRGFVGQPFSLFCFHFRLDFDVERLFLLVCFLYLRRVGRHLRRQQRLGRLERVHLFAPIDDERLLATHGRISDYGQRDVEAAFEIPQMPALVIENVECDVGSGPHHQIVGGALHQYFL